LPSWMRGSSEAARVYHLFSSAAAWPLAAVAQTPPKIPRVGCVVAGTDGGPIFEAFRQRLRELGYLDWQTIALEVRWLEGRLERIPELVAELVGLKVDVLVATNNSAALAAKNATGTIPIVIIAADPVGQGLVASLSRPGGNVTGLSVFSEAITGKRLQLLKEVVPGLARIAVLRNPMATSQTVFWQETDAAARKLGVVLKPLEVRGPTDFEAAFAAAKQSDAQALLALDDPLTIAYSDRIVALVAISRLPAMYGFREFPVFGGPMSYGPNQVDLFRRAATFVDQILKGAKPADLPVEQPTKFELVINLKTAKALGLTIPTSIMALADEVIEW